MNRNEFSTKYTIIKNPLSDFAVDDICFAPEDVSVFENTQERFPLTGQNVSATTTENEQPAHKADEKLTPSKSEQAKDQDEVRAFHAGNKEGGAKNIGQMERTNATALNEIETSKAKDKDSEAFQRQLMLRSLMQDMQDTLGRINAAIDATETIKDLLKKKKFDVDNPDHFHLLVTAGVDPKLAENGGLTEVFLDEHERELQEKKQTLDNNLHDAQELYDRFKANPDDPTITKEIQDLQNSKEGKFKMYSLLGKSSLDNNIENEIAAIAGSDDTYDSDTDSIWDDEIEAKDPQNVSLSYSPAQIIYGQSFDAPDIKGHFVAAVSPDNAQPEVQADYGIQPATIPAMKNGLG